jgi:hypothetical protein
MSRQLSRARLIQECMRGTGAGGRGALSEAHATCAWPRWALMLQVLPKRSARAQPPTSAQSARGVMAGVGAEDHLVFFSDSFRSIGKQYCIIFRPAYRSAAVWPELSLGSRLSFPAPYGMIRSHRWCDSDRSRVLHTRLCSSVLQSPCEVDEPTPV